MVERLVRNEKVRGSTPLGSTSLRSERSVERRLPRRNEVKAELKFFGPTRRATTRQASWRLREFLLPLRSGERRVPRRNEVKAGSHFPNSNMAFCYVYILQTTTGPEHYNVVLTDDLQARLRKHKAAEVPHSRKITPWKIKTAISFTDRELASRFERYLKTSSGRAFAKKRL